MWKNPVVTAIAGLLVGFIVGNIVAQKQPVAAVPAAQSSNPHAGVPGAPPVGGAAEMSAQGGRAAAATEPRLMEQLREAEKILATDPNNYEHLVHAANVLYDMNSYAKAGEYYEKAIAIRADSADVLTDLGVCCRETGKHQRALELFDRAATLKPEHWQSRYNAIVVRIFDLNDLPGAEQELAALKQLKGKVDGLPDLAGIEQEINKRKK